MKIGEKDELFDRESAQGSVYDKMYFTDDQLKQGAEINQKAAAGEITWDSAHNWWENTRAGYGYSGGKDGHGYSVLAKNTVEPAKEEFSYASAPSYANKYAAPINELLGSVLNREAFTYDPANDPMYQQYKDSYTRMGQQAMEDTLAQVSARTGGLASSYAGTAAQQTYNGYMSALADKVPELRQLAYQMYMDEGDTQRQNLELLQNLEEIAYGRYLNDVDQHNADRNFAYGVHRDQVADQQRAEEWAYQAGRDRISDNRYDQEYKDTQAATNKADAQARINAYLAANGSVADLDGDLITASGYTEAELAALERYYADQRASEQKVVDRMPVPPVKPPEPAPVGVPETYGEVHTASGKQVDPAVVEYFNELMESGTPTERLLEIVQGWVDTGYRGMTEEAADALFDTVQNWGRDPKQ